MFRTRVKRWKSSKPKRRWERAQEQKRLREEQQREDLKPTCTLHHRAIVMQVHVIRSFRKRECCFEFGRYETDRKRFYFKQVFCEDDLDDLAEAIAEARDYARKFRRNGFVNACDESSRSRDASRLPVRGK